MIAIVMCIIMEIIILEGECVHGYYAGVHYA